MCCSPSGLRLLYDCSTAAVLLLFYCVSTIFSTAALLLLTADFFGAAQTPSQPVDSLAAALLASKDLEVSLKNVREKHSQMADDLARQYGFCNVKKKER